MLGIKTSNRGQNPLVWPEPTVTPILQYCTSGAISSSWTTITTSTKGCPNAVLLMAAFTARYPPHPPPPPTPDTPVSLSAIRLKWRNEMELKHETRETFLSGLGDILDTVSKDTEDTAHSCILSVSKIHFHPTFIHGICI